MNSEILQIGNIIGAILQPLYFCLFMFVVKQIKDKRIFFILISIIDYFIIQNIIKFNLGVNADIFYAIIFYINLKILYKDKARITDVITYVISNILLGISSIINTLIFGLHIHTIVISIFILMLFIYLLKNKLFKIDEFYNKFWNRHNDKNMLKSVTIRGLSASITIFLFTVLHFWIIYLLLK